ncbi:YfiR family protein [Enterovibrio sp. 27052020O]|uniref:YfiR family protein n=1 Tax=Enterovibrio sp. 27052020O TaxID=3241166 RepID=UPI00388F1774
MVIIITVSLGVRANEFRDEDLKAVYLFRFAFLTDWKDRQPQNGRYEFCADGKSAVSQRLQDVVAQKPEQAIFRDIALEDDIELGCHIVYTTENEEQRIGALRSRFPDALIVGEGKSFTAAGGMVAFIKVNNRVKPLVNRKNLLGVPFTLRSQLLSIAVIDEEGNA